MQWMYPDQAIVVAAMPVAVSVMEPLVVLAPTARLHDDIAASAVPTAATDADPRIATDAAVESRVTIALTSHPMVSLFAVLRATMKPCMIPL